MTNTFFAIDVETASLESDICQIGLVQYQDGQCINKWEWLVNPETRLFYNEHAHGITYEHVKDAPTFDIVFPQVMDIVGDCMVIHHMPFVRYSTQLACCKYDITIPDYANWFDTCKFIRRVEPDLAKRGYGLFNTASYLALPVELGLHHATKDAFITSLIYLKCLANSTIATKEELFSFINKPIAPKNQTKISCEGNPNGIFYGEKIVFTGTLSMPRSEAAKVAASVGCNVGSGVTKDTTMLVVGIPNIASFKVYDKSTKQRKAEDLMNKGYDIKIINENDFINIVNDGLQE